jgi:hypothetical protein
MPTNEQAAFVRLPAVYGLVRIVGYNLWGGRQWIILQYTPGDSRQGGDVTIVAEITTVTQSAWRSPNQIQQARASQEDRRPPGGT